MKNLNTKKVLNILKIILFVCIGSSILVSISNIFEVEFLRKIFGHFDMGFSLTSAILYIYILLLSIYLVVVFHKVYIY